MLIQTWSVSLPKDKQEFGIMKTLVEITHTMKSALSNPPELMKPTNTTTNTFHFKKLSWSEISSMSLKIDANKDSSQNNSETESDRILDLRMPEELSTKNGKTLRKEWSWTELTCGKIWLDQKSQRITDQLLVKLTWLTTQIFQLIKQHHMFTQPILPPPPMSQQINPQRMLTHSVIKRQFQLDWFSLFRFDFID